MSSFAAEVVRIDVAPHPGADRLEIVKIRGQMWECVAAKGQFSSGDLAIYFPVDSVLPEGLVQKLGIEKMYHKRLRTVKLRGRISQGLVAPLSVLPEYGKDGDGLLVDGPIPEGFNVTEILGITKYEVPIPIHMAGKQMPDDPSFFRYTDIENIKRFPDALEPQEWVAVTEKIHGTNARAAKVDGKLLVGSHRLNLVEAEGNLYWRAAKAMGLREKLQEGEQVFFEVYGSKVQRLTYGKKPGEIAFGIFDVVKDKKYLDFLEFQEFLEARELGSMVVPLIATAQWTPDIARHSTGNSIIAPDQIREGVVIKPMKERYSEKLQGRCIVKAINDEYLAKADQKDDAEEFVSH